MTEPNFGNMAALYKKIGMNPQGELVSSRIASAEKIYGSVESKHLVSLLRGALGIAKQPELMFMDDVLAADDTTYVSGGEGKELQLLATALLRRALSDEEDFACLFALGIVVSSFGGVRPTLDEDLVAAASRLLTERRVATKVLPEKFTNKAKPNLAADFEGMQPYVDNGQFREAFPTLKKIIEGTNSYAHNVGSHLVTQLQAIANGQRRLTEQMEVHWWVLGAWSLDENKPFSEFSKLEGCVRVGIELARLSTASSYGLFAAPALIQQVLGDEVAKSETAVKEIAVSGSREWRMGWTKGLMQAPELMSVLPITAGVCLALDSDDESDWEPRYARQLQVEASTVLSVRDASLQVYHEQLLLRELQS